MKSKANLFDRLVLFLFCLLFTSMTYAQESTEPKGDLIMVMTELVIPEHRDAYVEWGKELKAIADKANFRSFYVDSDPKGFYYIFVIGKTMADFDAFEKEWEAFEKANPAVVDLYKKYGHTMSGSSSAIYRHNPGQSYSPAGYKDPGNHTYNRFYSAVVKPGKHEEIQKLLAEYKKLWADKGVKTPYNVYWSVIGAQGGEVVYVDGYTDRQAWVNERADVLAKVGEAKLMEMDKRWRALVISENEWESASRSDMTHIKK